MAVDLLLGLQWGDEGKGKIVDVLTKNYDIIARFQGGPNAGHTLEFDGIKHVLRTIPSGIFHDKSVNVVGNGVVIDLKRELERSYLVRLFRETSGDIAAMARSLGIKKPALYIWFRRVGIDVHGLRRSL